MAQTIQIKRSTSTATPTALANGELAYSANSNKLFVGRPGGASGDIDAIGGKYYTDIITGAASANTASKLVLRDGSGNFSAGTITANLTGNVTGNVTGNTSGTALTVTQAAQTAITSLGTLTALTVDNITIDGHTISDAGTLSLDIGGDINLDAGGGEIFFFDDGTQTGYLSMASSNLTLKSVVSDKDILFKGNDGGSDIIALTLDMSAAGAATFNSEVNVGSNLEVNGWAGVDGNLRVGVDKFNVTAASGNTQIDGTLGVDGSFDVDGVVNLNNTTQSTAGDQATGAVIIDGGVGIAKNLNIGGAGDIEGALTVGGTITGDVTGDITGDVTGNADTATILATARTIGGVSFNGSANIVPSTITVADTTDTTSFVGLWESASGSLGPKTDAAITYNAGTGMLTATGVTAALTGNATTATTLQTARTINGVSFNGGANITTLTAGTGVAVSGTAVSIGQAVATTSNVTFNNVAVDGTLTSDDIQATTLTASGHVIVTGNLTVNGTTTTVNSNTVAIGDAILELNSDETGTPSANAGIEIERGTSTNVAVLWNETTDYWQLTEDGSSYSKIMTAGNFASSFTGVIDGGTY